MKCMYGMYGMYAWMWLCVVYVMNVCMYVCMYVCNMVGMSFIRFYFQDFLPAFIFFLAVSCIALLIFIFALLDLYLDICFIHLEQSTIVF